MATAIVADSSTNVLGDFVDAAKHIIDSGGCKLVVAKCIVQIGHVCSMMLVVMDLHRLRINVRLKRIVVVGQWWKFECHKTFLLIVSKIRGLHLYVEATVSPSARPIHRVMLRASYTLQFSVKRAYLNCITLWKIYGCRKIQSQKKKATREGHVQGLLSFISMKGRCGNATTR